MASRSARIYGARLERDVASPYVALRKLHENRKDVEEVTASVVKDELDRQFSTAYSTRIAGSDVQALQSDMIEQLEADDPTMRQRYSDADAKVGEFFDSWFDGFGRR